MRRGTMRLTSEICRSWGHLRPSQFPKPIHFFVVVVDDDDEFLSLILKYL